VRTGQANAMQAWPVNVPPSACYREGESLFIQIFRTIFDFLSLRCHVLYIMLPTAYAIFASILRNLKALALKPLRHQMLYQAREKCKPLLLPVSRVF
jgi:hypothetical protein